ncbi:CynX/NimT family MFS transporter [Streptomyces sp. NPDC007971]|uniref:CynX/NimT family MFS transporter n=1 Tax=Streptomyces sp. NPDC007971 TaxID=3364799 RepID=UPI0036EB1DA5
MNRTTRLRVLIGLVLLTLNLRAAITVISPVLGDLQGSFGLSGSAVSVLATLPILCLGVFAPLAPPVSRRIGVELTTVGALALITAGILLRLLPSTPALFAGTVLAGAGIAIGNVLTPAIIKRHFADRTGLFTGLAMTLMALSGAVAAGTAVPLAEAADWRTALAVWALPASLALPVWGALALHGRTRRESAPAHPSRTPHASLLRSPLAWSVTAFLGVVSLMFYVLVAWLPAIMRDHGYDAADAGTMVSVMLTVGIPLGFAVPVWAARLCDQRPLVLAVIVLKLVSLGGLLVAPGADWVWVCLLGLATGSAFPLAMTLLTLRSPNPLIAARLSGMAQTGGYLVAGAGPLAIGLLHSLTHSWNGPLLLLLALAVPETLFGLVSARPGFAGPGDGHPVRPRTPPASSRKGINGINGEQGVPGALPTEADSFCLVPVDHARAVVVDGGHPDPVPGRTEPGKRGRARGRSGWQLTGGRERPRR